MAVGGELRVSAGGGRLFGHGGSSRRRLGAGGARQVSGRRGDGAPSFESGTTKRDPRSRTDFHRTEVTVGQLSELTLLIVSLSLPYEQVHYG